MAVRRQIRIRRLGRPLNRESSSPVLGRIIHPPFILYKWRDTMPTMQETRRFTQSKGADQPNQLDKPQHQGGDGQHAEGTVARMIEEQTAKLPSDLFLWAAGASV